MIGNLDILVVDDRPETVRFLTEFLIQRCRRVDVASSAREAMTAVTRRKAAGERYHLVISDFVMAEADGLALLRELRGRQDEVPFVFATGYRQLNPAFEPEAKRLGALAILDKPIDLRQVEDLLNSVTANVRKQQEEQGDQPFFGTSRMYRKSTDGVPPPPPPPPPVATPAPFSALEPRSPAGGTASYTAPPLAPVAGALEPARALPPIVTPAPAVPVSGYQRRPSGLVRMTTTARIRRSVDPNAPGTEQGGTGRLSRTATPQPPTTFTTRLRRGVEGSSGYQRGAVRTESGRMVSCTMCGRTFLVMAKPEAYTTVCLHCGQLQRIDPS